MSHDPGLLSNGTKRIRPMVGSGQKRGRDAAAAATAVTAAATGTLQKSRS